MEPPHRQSAVRNAIPVNPAIAASNVGVLIAIRDQLRVEDIESRTGLAPSAINIRLTAIHKAGVRAGNWLTKELESQFLDSRPDIETLKGE